MATATKTEKDGFLDVYEREHQTTMKVLRAFPADKPDFTPHPLCKTARELAWTFVLERGLGAKVFRNEFATEAPMGTPPPPPQTWPEVVQAVETAHREFGDLIRGASDQELNQTSRFYVGPKTMGDIRRLDFLWFLIQDQIHHRGQFSVYLRASGAKVPSIYGPSADEPWR